MGAATPLMTGIRQVLSVEVDGRTRHATTRAQLVHPAPGEAVCLARTRHLLGRVTFALADQRLCAGR